MAENHNPVPVEQRSENTEEYIDLLALLIGYLRVLRKRWYLLLLSMGICAALFSAYNLIMVKPSYTASATFSIERTSSVYTNAIVAKRLASGVSVISATRDFRTQIAEEMQVSKISDSYAFSAVSTETANLMTVYARSPRAELSNALLKAFETVYPTWAVKTTGNCSIVLLDEALCSARNTGFSLSLRTIVIGLAAGFLLWMTIVGIGLLAIHRVHGESDMSQVVNSVCMGVLPEVVKKKRGKSTRETLLISGEHVDSGYQQSVRSMRHEVGSYLKKNNKKVMMVTSTLSQEGKSLITLNLAIAFQRRGKKVMVIDADMRHSGIPAMLGISQDEGTLADYLTQKNTSRLTIRKKHGISIIPAGKVGTDASEFLNVHRMTLLIERLREMYDIILIDSPAVESAGDAVIFSQAADAVLYVIRGNQADVREIRKGIEPFYQNQKLAGYVLNQMDASPLGYSAYRYGYGYGAGYSHYRSYGKYKYYGTYEKNPETDEDEDEYEMDAEDGSVEE